MIKKQIKTSKKSANKKLSTLEKKLLSYAKKGQRVLLYGKDTHGREDLIKKIHFLNGGKDSSWEYIGSEKNINSFEDIHDARTKALEEQDTEKAKKLTLKRFQSFLKKHKYTKPQRAEEIFSILQQDYPIAPEIFVQTKERFVKAIIPQILVIVQQLDDYDCEIKKHYDLHPDKDIFHSLPGVGKDIGPRLLSCFGDRRDRFTHFNDIQCLAGTAPVTRKSGRSCHIFFRFACNKIFRNVVDQMAFTSLQRSLWAKNYYDQLRKKGNSHHSALRSLANKWIKIIHQLWVTRTTYDENYHLAQITMRALTKKVAI